MGNCVFRGFGEVDDPMIKVMTFNGGVMELYPPVTAECITNGFPGHGIFHSQDLFSKPLLHSEELVAGELYHLRPLNSAPRGGLPSLVAPYRMSFDHRGLWRRHDMELFPKCADVGSGGASGVWKVKLVISPAQLNEILAQDSRTEALVESVRVVAKCATGLAASVASSDQWSLASSRKASSENMG